MAAAKKYGPLASKTVEREMDKMKAGTLKTSAGDKVTNPKQAIAIGLSEARRAGGEGAAAARGQEGRREEGCREEVAGYEGCSEEDTGEEICSEKENCLGKNARSPRDDTKAPDRGLEAPLRW